MKKIHYLFYFCLLFSCKHDVLNKKETPFDDLEKLEESGNIASLSNVKISNDFENWLITNGYSNYNFTRNDISGGSFGGKKNASQLIKKQPVIFIHGNGDKATGTIFGQNGWTKSINYFKAKDIQTLNCMPPLGAMQTCRMLLKNTIPRPIYCMSENLLKLF